MKISTLLDYIDNREIALPEFQRGYVWNRDQIRGLFDSLYHCHPVGTLLVWATESKTTVHRGDSPLAAGIVKLLLDGQQRVTTLYGVVRGKPPDFFDGNKQTFTGLHFHLGTESFEFYQPVKMRDDPLWINVTHLLMGDDENIGAFMKPLVGNSGNNYLARLLTLRNINNRELHIDEVTGEKNTIDIVVDIFNRVNSGGTKLSKGDLALAKICANWPDARKSMKDKLKTWTEAGYNFNIDWLLRSVNAALTGKAKFSYLQDKGASDIQEGLKHASKHIDTSLNLIAGRLGLDHDQVLFGRFGVPVMVRYMAQKQALLSAVEQDKLLFWFAQAGMWGRFSGSTETMIEQDLEVLEAGGLDALLKQLQAWRGNLRVEPGHFTGWSLGARFYPVLYMLTRMGEARDWGTGLPLRTSLLGKRNRLEVHHIFPKAQLYKWNHSRPEVNALANFCFLTKDANMSISNRLPEAYFEEIETRHPGALASQWIPSDPNLWKIDCYREFLEARQKLLADEANNRFEDLLHGDMQWLGVSESPTVTLDATFVEDEAIEDEESELNRLNDWIGEQRLSRGQVNFDYADPETGEQKAVFDLVWPDGLQPGLTAPVAVLLNEPMDVLSLASAAGFRCFTSVEKFRSYVTNEILGGVNN